jgi:DNA-binding NtrC family response regulator
MLHGTAPAMSTGRVLKPGRVQIPDEPFSLDELNREIVQKTLEKFEGNKTRTADFLGLTRSALRSRLDES